MGVCFQQLLFPDSTSQQRERGRLQNVYVLLGLVGLFLAGCSLETPKAPRWTTNLTVPLADRHYDVPYIIEHADQPELVWDSLSGARVEIERTLDTIFVADNITFDDLAQDYSDSLGIVTLRPSENLTEEVSLAEFYDGPVGDIPGFSSQSQKEFSPLADMQRAEVAQGELRIEVTNKLGLTIDSLEITIEDIITTQEIGRLNFPGTIPTQEKRSGDLDLAGQAISDRLGFVVYLRTPGGYLNSANDRTIEITAYFPDSLLVNGATAVVPAIERAFVDTIDLADDIQASSAEFQSGQIDFEITNESNLPFEVELRLPDLTHHGSTPGVNGSLDPGSSEEMTVDLENTTYSNPTQQNARLRVEVVFQTPGSSVPVDVSSADRLRISAQISSPVIESMTGILPPTIQNVDGLTAEIDLPAGFENVGLAAGEIQLEILSSLSFPGEFSFELTGELTQTLSIEGEILAATGGEPIASNINVVDAASLLSPIPAIITAAGSVTYGDGTTSGTVRSTDFLVPSFSLVAPLSLYLDGVDYVGEAEAVSLHDEGDRLMKRFGAASIITEFENRLPFGVTIEVKLADRRADLPGNPGIVLGPTEISPAVVDANGRTIESIVSSDIFTISADQAHILEADSIFITEEIQFFSADGSAVTLRDSDFIHWSALLQVETLLGDRTSGR